MAWFISHWRRDRWRTIPTAPYNRDLELECIERGRRVTLPFPVRRTNDDSWVNADLGTHLHVEPSRWRVWPHDRPSETHRDAR
jgi:hypothetical protein